MDFATLAVLAHAKSGDIRPLAKHIEDGGYICPETRLFLARYLRGKLRYRPGNRRTYSQVEREATLASTILYLRRQMGRETGEGFKLASEYAAIEAYLKLDETANRATLRSLLRRGKLSRMRKPA